MRSRVMPCSLRPVRLAGTMNTGSTISVSSVRRHSSTIIAARVVTRMITFDTMEPSVPVTASWAPITSLFNRLMSAPVWLRVKKAID